MTVTEQTLPRGADPVGLGVVGSRQLVAVQTFDIARLTSHPVVLIPSSFIAVTGRGPRDSNESGKTSFNAAVALLLGDPEWRVSGGGVASVAELLFEPDTAGVAATRYPAAQVGYIIGVFADPDDIARTAHTVWMKLSSQPRYLQVRHASGVLLVSAESDQEQHRQAAAVWKSLPASSELGAQSYVDTLYGRSPRCLAYVAARGKQRSGPSLLKMDTGAFRPQDIGAALVRLTGRNEALETEQAQRRTLAGELEAFDTVIKAHASKWTDEEEVLKGVVVRKKVRSLLAEGQQLWRQHFARGLLDALTRKAGHERAVAAAQESLEEARADVLSKQIAEAGLAEDEDVRERASAAEEAFRTAEEKLRERLGVETSLTTTVALLRKQLADLERLGAVRNRYDVSTAEENLKSARALRAEAVGRRTVALRELERLDSELEDAVHGRSGAAGECLKLLTDAGVGAKGLLDSMEVAESHRDLWEARLQPWRDAVCVAHGAADLALPALASQPGAVLIVGGADPDEPTLPDGVLAAPPAAVPFLTTLQERSVKIDPELGNAVHDPALRTFVLAGFSSPITGRVHLIAALTGRRDAARDELQQAESAATLADELEEEADRDLVAAKAAEQYRAAVERIRTVETAELPALREALVLLEEKRETTLAAHTAAQGALQSLKSARAQARHERELAETELTRATLDVGTAERALADVKVEYWRLEFGGSAEAARQILNWGTDHAEDDEARMVARPPSVALDPDKPVEKRTQDTLAIRANDRLTEIVTLLEIDRANGDGAPTLDIAEAVSKRERQTDAEGAQLARDALRFSALAGALQAWLLQGAERDELAEEQITLAREQRTQEMTFTEARLNGLRNSLANIQDSLEQRIESNLKAIDTALDALNRVEGFGAGIQWEVLRPQKYDDTWTWKVTPMWRRSPGGRMLPYNNATNSAQEKLFSVHLVLAALLASPNPQGRVLILDELGDSLGEEHRRDVLTAVSKVARDYGITVLGTCQDAVMPDAAAYCAEILYFCYPSKAEALNLPTRMFGFDGNRERVELTVEQLGSARPWQ